MPIRHQITDTDTVEYLALQYLGDVTKWRDIVDYNNLVYPYLSPNNDDKMKVFANGYVHVKRDVATQPISIRAGWTFKTGRNIMSTALKTFQVINDHTMAAGETDAYLYVRAIVPGVQGNVSSNTITELGQEFIDNGIAYLTVTNENPIVNGVEGFIRTTGEYIFIPTDEDITTLQQHGTGFTYSEMEYFYGSDLRTDALNDLIFDDTSGDVQTINYTDNVAQAVNRRFTTEKGDMLSDFTFGNGIADIIADTKLPLDAKQRLIELDILEALNYEDRVQDPVVNSITIDQLNRCCYVDVTMTVVKLGGTITISNLQIGGTS